MMRGSSGTPGIPAELPFRVMIESVPEVSSRHVLACQDDMLLGNMGPHELCDLHPDNHLNASGFQASWCQEIEDLRSSLVFI